MKKSDVSVKRLQDMGYRAYMVNTWTGNKIDHPCYLDDIVCAVQTGRKLVFTNDDVRGMIYVRIDGYYLPAPCHAYACRKMTDAELVDADLRLRAVGLVVQRG